MALTAEQRQSVERARAELDRSTAGAERWLEQMTGGITGDLLLNDAERAAVKATRDEMQRVKEWNTTWRTWVEKGFVPTGHSYKLSHYIQVGKDLAQALSFYTRQGYNASAFNLAADAAEKKVEQVGKAAESALQKAEDAANKLAGPWSWKTKGLVGLAATAVVGILARGLVK